MADPNVHDLAVMAVVRHGKNGFNVTQFISNPFYRPECYNLFEHNCNTFSNEAGQFLTGRTIPKYIQELPKDVLNT
jgi:hypothetical protein